MTADFDLKLFHKTIIERMNAWVMFLSPKGTILFWNKAAEQITGYLAEDVIGTSDVWKHLYPDPVYRKKITGMIVDVIEEQAYLRNFETRIITSNGTHKNISWNTSEVRSPDGAITGYVAVGIDITDKVAQKQKIREREELFHGITSAAYDGIVLLNDFDQITYWNRSAESIFSYGINEAKGRSVIDLLAPETEHPDWEHALAIDGSHELNALRKGGELVPVELTLSRVTIKDLPHTIMVIRDISDRKQAETQMRLLAAIVDASKEAIISISSDSRILSWNPAAEGMTGITQDSAIGTHATDLIRLKEGEDLIADAIASSSPGEITGILLDSRGIEHDVIISLTPLPGSDRFSLLIRDVTAEKKAKRMMVTYIKEAAMRLKMPVAVVRENIDDILLALEDDSSDISAAVLRLQVQRAHLARITETLNELNAALTGKGDQIPEAYRVFLLE